MNAVETVRADYDPTRFGWTISASERIDAENVYVERLTVSAAAMIDDAAFYDAVADQLSVGWVAGADVEAAVKPRGATIAARFGSHRAVVPWPPPEVWLLPTPRRPSLRVDDEPPWLVDIDAQEWRLWRVGAEVVYERVTPQT